MIVHPLEDQAAICGAETLEDLWLDLIARPTLRAFGNDFDAVAAFKTLHRDGNSRGRANDRLAVHRSEVAPMRCQLDSAGGGVGHMPSPTDLLAADPKVLRDSGLSARKAETLRALAERFVDGA